MYQDHFDLSGPPFQLTPTPNALYLSPTHSEALAILERGLLYEPSAFTLLVGESGVGKTTFLSLVLARRYRKVHTALLTNPGLDFDHVMQVLMSQLAPGWSGHTRLDMHKGFDKLLNELEPGERVIIAIDEAQELSDQVFEGLRVLSDRNSFKERRLHIILVGQLELAMRLARPEMHALNERIGARATIRPLVPSEVREYIDRRLRAKDGTVSKVFVPAALSYLVAHSGGIPRRVNVLSHNSMLQAFGVTSKKVSLSMVKKVVGEYEDLLVGKPASAAAAAAAAAAGEPAPATKPAKPRARLMQAALAVTVLALVVVGALLFWSEAWVAFDSSHAALGGRAIRSAREPYMTGPGTPLRPVAATADRGSL